MISLLYHRMQGRKILFSENNKKSFLEEWEISFLGVRRDTSQINI
ncbi:hypothetical protein EMIT040CA3_30025 [Bacillus pseudomycoides]